MTDKQKSKQALIQECNLLRQRVADLAQSELVLKRAEEELALSGLRIQALLDLHLLGAAPQEQFLDFALEASLRMTQSEFAFIGLMNEAESVMTIHRWSQDAVSECALDNKPILYPIAEAGWWGDCVRKRKPVLVNDYSAPHPTRKGIPEGHVPIRRFLAVPIFDAGRIVAVAAAANKQGEYTDSDIGALTSLTNKLWEMLRHNRTEEKLRESEGRYKRITEGLTDYQYTVRVEDGRAVETRQGPACATVTGYTAEEFAADPYLWFQMVAPEDREQVQECVQQILAGNEIAPMEHRIVRKDGERRWVRDTVILEKNAAGKLLSYDGVIKDITEHKRAEEALRRSEEEAKRLAQENALVAEMGRIIGSTPNIDEVFERFSKAVAKLIPFDRIVINLGSLQEDDSYVRYVAGIDVPNRRIGEHVPLTGTATAECFRTKASLLIQPKDAKEIEELGARFPRFLPNLEAGIRSAILVPLIAEDETIGVLSLRTTKTKAYTDQDVRLAESIASQIAGAVANAQLYEERMEAEAAARKNEEEAKRLAQENAVMAEIGRVISSSLNIEEVYERFADLVKPFISFDRIAITFINPEDHTATTTYISGIHMAGRREGEAFSLAGSITEEVWRTRSILLLQPKDSKEIQEAIDRFPFFVNTVQAGFRSLMSVPLVSKNEVIGVLHLRSPKPNAYSEKDLRFCKRVVIQISGAIANAQLFAERKRAEEKLQESEERFRLLVENAPDAIFVQTQGRFAYINKAAIRLFGGMFPDQLLGHPVMNRFHPDYHGAVRERIRLLNEERKDVPPLEQKYLKLDGTPFDVEVSAVPFLYEDQKGALVFFRDITERKRAEEDKAKLEAQLQQAQKMESVGRLAGGVAHDFNNMLGVILGHVEMAIEQVDPDQPLHAALEEIRRAARRSADLTRQLLAFARRQTIAPKVLDLNETMAGMLKMLQRLIGEDIDLAWMPGANLWQVKMDPSQIDQILANLCVNARDAIADVGKITLETGNSTLDEAYCSVHAGFVPGEYVLIAVSDNGCGMDRETLGHIFEPFFTTKGVGEGTGLGLATVYGAVKQNNGFINVYSEPGQGTTIKIYLPRHMGKGEQAGTEGVLGPAMRGQETILLVEDEPAILEMTTVMLERQGYTVLAASTPGEGIRLAREHAGEIHLLMTDVVMPEMNGRDLAKNLLSLYPHLKRLFMSGYTANVVAHHGVLDEGVHFIQKPFSIKELAAKVREALDGE